MSEQPNGIKSFFASVTPAGWIQILLLLIGLIAMGTRAEYRLMAVEEMVRELRTDYVRKEVVELRLVALQSQVFDLRQIVERMDRRLERTTGALKE